MTRQHYIPYYAHILHYHIIHILNTVNGDERRTVAINVILPFVQHNNSSSDLHSFSDLIPSLHYIHIPQNFKYCWSFTHF